MEYLSTSDHNSAGDTNQYVSTSAATTVVRKTRNSILEHHLSDSSDDATKIRPSEDNHQRETCNHSIKQNPPKIRVNTKSIMNAFNYARFNSHNNSGQQQPVSTSGDIEAMTLRQFRMSSLGC